MVTLSSLILGLTPPSILTPSTLYTLEFGINYPNRSEASPWATHSISDFVNTSALKILNSYFASRYLMMFFLSVDPLIFEQRIRPVLEFCSFTASLLPKSCCLAIEGIQRKFTKMLFDTGCTKSYRARCQILNLDPLWLRRLKLNLIFLHALIYQNAHLASERPAFAVHHSYNLRNTEFCLNYNMSRTVFHQYSFLSFYPRLWNRLPLSIRSISNYHIFKRRLSLFLSIKTVDSLLNPQLPLDLLFEQGPGKI